MVEMDVSQIPTYDNWVLLIYHKIFIKVFVLCCSRSLLQSGNNNILYIIPNMAQGLKLFGHIMYGKIFCILESNNWFQTRVLFSQTIFLVMLSNIGIGRRHNELSKKTCKISWTMTREMPILWPLTFD